MKNKTFMKSSAVIFALVLSLSTFALWGCTGNSSQASSGSLDEQHASEAASIEVVVVLDISAAVAENDPTALELEKTQGAEAAYQVKIPEGGTILDALVSSGAEIGMTSSTMGDYVSTINGLASGSVGSESGWTFLVNDEMVMESADVATLSAGDTVKWQFVTSFE